MNKYLFALQYWNGDKSMALRLARLIADIESSKVPNVDFMFVRRFDVVDDQEFKDTVTHVSKKFNVRTYKTKRAGAGHPEGCNAMWHDLFEMIHQESRHRMSTFPKDYFGVFTFEADCIPIKKDWIKTWTTEYEEGGKDVLGFYQPFQPPNQAEHINGNAIFKPNIIDKFGCHDTPLPNAWDVHWGPTFVANATKSRTIINMYRKPTITEEEFDAIRAQENGPSIIHGVRDLSLMHLVEKHNHQGTL